ncbi:MAG: TonB-dependent receptor [Lysobacter sp.]
MTLKTTKLRDAISFALVVGATAVTGTAFAQDAAPAQEAPAQEATTLDRIEVTGSRIRQVDAETSQPILVIGRDDIEQSGRTSVAELLQNIAVNGAPTNTQVNNGGDGSSTVDLRGLGSNRTLVLVNGRRWVTGLGGSVDLNTIPSSMVERVEVLKDGASSIYGSDAIAGVVNVITRQNFEGAEAHVYTGQFSEGDGQRTSADFTLGANSDRGNIVMGVSHHKEESVMAGDREISEHPVSGFGSQRWSSFDDNGQLWDMTIDGTPTGDYDAWAALAGSESEAERDRAGLNRLVVNEGADGTDLANYHPFSPAAGDGYNFAKDNYLRTPQERTSLYVQGRFDITDNISFKTDALYNERLSAQRLAGFPVGEGAYLSGAQGLSGDSYYNPTKGTANQRDVSYSRRLVEAPRLYEQDVKTWHFYGGFEGFFDIGDRGFNWDVGYAFNRNDQVDTQTGDLNMQALRNATGPSFMDPETGDILCGAPGAVIEGCTPFNPFSSPGEIQGDMLSYVLFTAKDKFQNTSKSYTANLSGDLFELPGGMAGFAAGYEHRKEAGYDIPDAFVSAGLSSGNARQPTSGSYSLDDYYLELLLPVLSDVPGAQLLEFSIASRYSDYSNFGETTNSKFGFKWKPVDSLLVRGNWAQGFRAPTINDLFGGAAASYDTFGDPCSSDSPYASRPEVAQRCADAGISPSYVQRTNSGPGYFGQTAYPFDWVSNVDLGPETATNKTLGFVFSPEFLTGFDISVDWWSIEIEDAISRPTATYMLDQCFVEGDQGFCDILYVDGGLTRDPLGTINYLARGLRNLAQRNVEGWDVAARYRTAETSIGRFAFSWDSSYISNFETRSTPDGDWDYLVGTYTGGAPTWRIRSNLGADWTMGDFGLHWTTRYFSGMEEDCPTFALSLCSDPDRVVEAGEEPRNHIGATTYHDVQARYNTPWNATVSVGVNNVFDKDPPRSFQQANSNSFDYQYDTPGQFYYVEYRQRF